MPTWLEAGIYRLSVMLPPEYPDWEQDIVVLENEITDVLVQLGGFALETDPSEMVLHVDEGYTVDTSVVIINPTPFDLNWHLSMQSERTERVDLWAV